MSITTVLFDLDGTLLPMDQEEFTRGYFELLAEKMSAYGYEKQQLVDAVWKGTAAMVKNAGDASDEESFWRKFTEMYGEKGDINMAEQVLVEQSMNEKTKKKSKHKWLIVLCVVAVVVAVIGFAIGYKIPEAILEAL